MGVYFPRDGGPLQVNYTYGGVPVDALDAETLKGALKLSMYIEARLLSRIYVMPCMCEKPTVYTRPSGQRICVNDGCGLAIAKPETATKRERP